MKEKNIFAKIGFFQIWELLIKRNIWSFQPVS